jgi:alkanesulfonate monooxygenase SsuD/methylene tetrahydromethanopterin reductase-like flavin-dependent oxidoreductase (luciferase family)
MKIGVCIFATDYAIRIDELAKAAEDRGFESLFVPEHTHIPTSRRTPFPAGEPLPKEYAHTHDPFVSLMMAAAVTKKLRVGTGICLIIERDTIVTAKAVASLDDLSGGRFEFGIGGGWNVEEMENHGTQHKTRFKKLREQVLAMKEIWTKDGGAVPRRVRELRSHLVMAQARAEAEPAGAAGRRVGSHAAAGGGFLRGLVPAREVSRGR